MNKRKEKWKAIDGFHNYEVSDLGRVRNINTGRLLKPFADEWGYLKVTLCIDGIMHKKRIHRLVAEAFLPNAERLAEVNHIDENKTNNAADNLEWCSHAYNMKHSGKNRVGVRTSGPIAVRSIAPNGTVTAYRSLYHAARSLGINPGNIWCVINGYTRTAGGLKWEVIE